MNIGVYASFSIMASSGYMPSTGIAGSYGSFERESYIQLNIEFQKIGRRDKKAFFNKQCLITEENSKRGKTRDLFRKIESIKGAFGPKMGHN